MANEWSADFIQWFGQSKVVDHLNKPRLVFHGTTSPIQVFSYKRQGFGSTVLGNYEIERYGIFAAEDPELARWYMNQGEDFDIPGGSIMPLYLKIESPLDTVNGRYTDKLFENIEQLVNSNPLAKTEYDGYRTARLLGDKWADNQIWTLFDADEYNEPEFWINLFKQLGYDGIKLRERIPGDMHKDSWAAFDPCQVKSAYDKHTQ